MDALAVDTEAMGLIHGRDRLCLVQIADQEDRVACVRIALGQSEASVAQIDGGRDGGEGVSISRDLMWRLWPAGWASPFNRCFAPRSAAGLARTYAPRHGLKDLVQELVGVELDKGAQSSDWGRVDELTDAQLAYAANDVRYLLPARRRLETMLRREGRWDLAQRCFRCIPVVAELDRLRFTQTFEH